MPIICNALENTSLDDFVAGVCHSIQSGESVHSWLSSPHKQKFGFSFDFGAGMYFNENIDRTQVPEGEDFLVFAVNCWIRARNVSCV